MNRNLNGTERDASAERMDLPAPGDTNVGGGQPLTLDERGKRIATIAYALASHRGFEPGYEMEDWLEAERQVDDEIAARASQIRTGRE